LSAYELAELTDDDSERSGLMTFVLVGGGATGVELAASMAQMAVVTLRGNFRHIDPAKTSIVLIEGGSSGLTMSEIQSGRRSHPERCVIGHPFNPPHLIPLVEIVGGAKTSEETIQRVTQFYASLGKQPVRLHKELPGHVANRLQAAIIREVYYLVSEGVLSAADADTALSWGPGLRWGIMGNMLLNHLGGGPGGIEHFLQQFAGPMTAWWKGLGQPELTPEVQKKLIDSVHAEVGSRTIAELEAERDEILLGLLELRTKRPTTGAPHEVAAE
jgi:3-hydroxyacyl-CoA dehydrogenase